MNIPIPVINRLCTIYRLAEVLLVRGVTRVSSTGLGRMIGVGSHTIRKDMGHLGEVGEIGSGYSPAKLFEYIRTSFGLDTKRSVCVAGLGRLGGAILNYERFANSGFSIVAGFDSNINRLETIRTSVDLYPAYEITDVVRKKSIEIGILAVPSTAAPSIKRSRVMANGCPQRSPTAAPART